MKINTISFILNKLNISQKELASKLSVSSYMIQQWKKSDADIPQEKKNEMLTLIGGDPFIHNLDIVKITNSLENSMNWSNIARAMYSFFLNTSEIPFDCTEYLSSDASLELLSSMNSQFFAKEINDELLLNFPQTFYDDCLNDDSFIKTKAIIRDYPVLQLMQKTIEIYSDISAQYFAFIDPLQEYHDFEGKIIELNELMMPFAYGVAVSELRSSKVKETHTKDIRFYVTTVPTAYKLLTDIAVIARKNNISLNHDIFKIFNQSRSDDADKAYRAIFGHRLNIINDAIEARLDIRTDSIPFFNQSYHARLKKGQISAYEYRT